MAIVIALSAARRGIVTASRPVMGNAKHATWVYAPMCILFYVSVSVFVAWLGACLGY